MKLYLNLIFLTLILTTTGLLTSCDAIIEPSISKRQIKPEAPSDSYKSTSYTINFWWDEVQNVLSYHLQVVSPNFTAPGSLVLDTIVTRNKFSFNLNPGTYQWRVLAMNGSSQTAYSSPRSFEIEASSIKQQTIQLTNPANSLITNQNSTVFGWGSLYGATKYHFQIDTNNFTNSSTIVSDMTIPGQQLNYTFPKDQAYQWRVRAENDTAQSLWSSVYIVTYDHTPPAAPALTAPTNGQLVSKPALLQWNTVATANRYKVYVFKSDSTSLYNANFPVVVSTNSYTFNSGNPGDKVYWKISAIDPAGNEGTSSLMRNFVLQ